MTRYELLTPGRETWMRRGKAIANKLNGTLQVKPSGAEAV